MDKQLLITAGIDYEEGLHRFADRASLYEKYLRKLLEDTSLTEVQAALARQDYETAFRAAHNLKGLAGNLSTNRLYYAAGELVEALRGGEPVTLAEPCLVKVLEIYAETTSAIKNAGV